MLKYKTFARIHYEYDEKQQFGFLKDHHLNPKDGSCLKLIILKIKRKM